MANNIVIGILVLTCGLLSFCYASSSTDSSLLPSTEECGIGSIPNKIISGNGRINAELDEFPWMALIEYERDNGQKGFYCEGALISKRYIMTAAHCVSKELLKNLKVVGVRLGEYNTATQIDCVRRQNQICAPEPLDVSIEEIIAHEQYSRDSKAHDIALLRLAKEVTYNDFVRPICLPKTVEDQARNYTGKRLTVSGWGQTETAPRSDVKWKLDLPVKSNNVCSQIYSKSGVTLNDGQMCAGGEKGRDACKGDGGAPLMVRNDETSQSNWFAIGIVSFGASPCGLENFPGVLTKVANYVPWIVSKMKP